MYVKGTCQTPFTLCGRCPCLRKLVTIVLNETFHMAQAQTTARKWVPPWVDRALVSAQRCYGTLLSMHVFIWCRSIPTLWASFQRQISLTCWISAGKVCVAGGFHLHHVKKNHFTLVCRQYKRGCGHHLHCVKEVLMISALQLSMKSHQVYHNLLQWVKLLTVLIQNNELKL